MKKALVLFAVLGLVASASASLEIFFTDATYGLTDPSLTYTATVGDGGDGAAYAAAAVPTGPMDTIEIAEGDDMVDAFVWIEFVDEPAAVKLQGLHLGYTGDIGQWASYYGDQFVDAFDRWQGDPNPYASATGGTLPINHVAVTSWGIQNQDLGTMDFMTYINSEGNVTALLGAVELGLGDAGMYLGDLGVSYSGAEDPEVVLYGATITPEPASLLLLGLAGLLIRRR